MKGVQPHNRMCVRGRTFLELSEGNNLLNIYNGLTLWGFWGCFHPLTLLAAPEWQGGAI